MPCVGALMAEGVRAGLMSTPHPLTPPAWTTVMTGRTPGNHGIFDFIWSEHRGDRVYFTLNNIRDVRAEMIWSMVSRRGGRVTVLNFPFLAPPPKLDGAIVPGLVSWKHLRRNVHPPELYEKLRSLPEFSAKRAAWDFENEKRATRVIPEEEREDWVSFHISRERQWYGIWRFLRREDPCDLSAILIDGVDKLQHVCWDQLDPAYAGRNGTEESRRVRALCLEYFRELDAFIGEVVESAGDDARIIVVSDHGFGPTEKVFRLNLWLSKKGYLSWAPTDHLDEAEKMKVEKLVTGHFVHLDWANTIAYAQSPATNGIHIRVAGGSGEGGLAATEYHAFRNRLIAELLEVKDPDTGVRVVTKVLKKEEAFPGAHNERCPDLTVVLHDYGFVSTLNKEPVVWTRPGVAGTHRPEGIFLARGPGIAKGGALTRQSITDVAATVLYSLDLPVPEDLESKVIEDAFEPSHLRGRPVVWGPPTQAPDTYAAAPARRAPENADDAEVFERLRALGYVE